MDREAVILAIIVMVKIRFYTEIPAEVISSFTGIQNDSRVRSIKMNPAKEEMKKFDRD